MRLEYKGATQIAQYIYRGDLESVNQYITEGGDLNIKIHTDQFSASLFSFTCCAGQVAIAKRLIESGYKPDDKERICAINFSIFYGHTDVLRYLFNSATLSFKIDYFNNVEANVSAASLHGDAELLYALYQEAVKVDKSLDSEFAIVKRNNIKMNWSNIVPFIEHAHAISDNTILLKILEASNIKPSLFVVALMFYMNANSKIQINEDSKKEKRLSEIITQIENLPHFNYECLKLVSEVLFLLPKLSTVYLARADESDSSEDEDCAIDEIENMVESLDVNSQTKDLASLLFSNEAVTQHSQRDSDNHAYDETYKNGLESYRIYLLKHKQNIKNLVGLCLSIDSSVDLMGHEFQEEFGIFIPKLQKPTNIRELHVLNNEIKKMDATEFRITDRFNQVQDTELLRKKFQGVFESLKSNSPLSPPTEAEDILNQAIAGAIIEYGFDIEDNHFDYIHAVNKVAYNLEAFLETSGVWFVKGCLDNRSNNTMFEMFKRTQHDNSSSSYKANAQPA